MIVRRQDGRTLLIRQTDHALLSGALAAAWAWDIPLRESVLVAAARHDDGWATWELSPRLDGDGRPLDFITTPVHQHVALYRQGIDLVCEEDPAAGLVVSLHGERLYTRPFVEGHSPRIDNLEGRDLALAESYVEFERRRQDGLAQHLPDAEEAWRLLQVWDRLSLMVCLQPVGESVVMTMPPVRGPEGTDVRIQMRGNVDGWVELDPYPFEGQREFEVQALDPAGDEWLDERSYREAYRLASRIPIAVRVRPAP